MIQLRLLITRIFFITFLSWLQQSISRKELKIEELTEMAQSKVWASNGVNFEFSSIGDSSKRFFLSVELRFSPKSSSHGLSVSDWLVDVVLNRSVFHQHKCQKSWAGTASIMCLDFEEMTTYFNNNSLHFANNTNVDVKFQVIVNKNITMIAGSTLTIYAKLSILASPFRKYDVF